MRILFVNENLGGHRTMHMYLRRALADHPEVDAEILDVPAPRLLRRLAAAPVPGLSRLDADLQPLRYQLAQSLVVRRALARHPPPDALHLYTQNVGLLSAAHLRGVPTVVSTDCTNVQNAFTLPYRRSGPGTAGSLALTRRLESRVYEAATLVVAQSAWAAGSLHDDYHVAHDRLRVIPFGVSLPPAPRFLAPDTPEITFVGATMARKGGWALVRSWREHLAGRSRLNLVTHDPVPPAEGLSVFNDVQPGDGRLLDLLERTSVFAFPSEIDKSSYAVLEAQSAGVPVVAYRVGAISELVEHGVTGLLVEPGDEAALTTAIAELVDDPDRRAAMARAARARVEEGFDVRTTTDALLETLGEAVARHRATA